MVRVGRKQEESVGSWWKESEGLRWRLSTETEEGVELAIAFELDGGSKLLRKCKVGGDQWWRVLWMLRKVNLSLTHHARQCPCGSHALVQLPPFVSFCAVHVNSR